MDEKNKKEYTKWELSHCSCGKRLPTIYVPGQKYYCKCGRTYGYEIEPAVLLQRIDDLEDRLRVLESNLGVCGKCGGEKHCHKIWCEDAPCKCPEAHEPHCYKARFGG